MFIIYIKNAKSRLYGIKKSPRIYTYDLHFTHIFHKHMTLESSYGY